MSLSTHVLDTGEGVPGVGIGVSLYRGKNLISYQATDDNGRIADLTEGKPLEPGEYRLVFHVASGFFERVEVSIAIPDPDSHYHVPLLVSPYSCTIYRGS